jgi:hypothetical protein
MRKQLRFGHSNRDGKMCKERRGDVRPVAPQGFAATPVMALNVLTTYGAVIVQLEGPWWVLQARGKYNQDA